MSYVGRMFKWADEKNFIRRITEHDDSYVRFIYEDLVFVSSIPTHTFERLLLTGGFMLSEQEEEEII
jgi:hypothetical protein